MPFVSIGSYRVPVHRGPVYFFMVGSQPVPSGLPGDSLRFGFREKFVLINFYLSVGLCPFRGIKIFPSTGRIHRNKLWLSGYSIVVSLENVSARHWNSAPGLPGLGSPVFGPGGDVYGLEGPAQVDWKW